ncbi:siderophore ABC transporter ATP-binding protein CdtA [Kineosporia mesophila]|uniref:Siderophore ABC transporter ATP-binding protein CdtA n=1 Tax=Kineosporia mesophila TaxID=566012 RepID=A0ABP6Z646_9ACTN|nr:ABC transporter ATP-binding protein [Kineosporia mesophila]MCD5352716.1 ABC transporter ATP-binding protein [Kineosporia mesophila]
MPTPGEPAVLRGDRLVLRYGRTTVIHDVSLELRPGRITALVGPNGSGKSTLLRALARLHDVESGRVLLDDQPASALSVRQFARRVTLFTQSRQAPPGLTVSEVVAFGRHPHRRRFSGASAQDRAAIDRAMRATGTADKAGRPVSELSGGEMQRVWLAASLAQETGVVLLDEPTNHLDLRYQVETLDLVRDLADERGVAVGIVLHDLDHAARIADSLVLLHAGRIHAAGDPLQVLTAEHLSEVYGLTVEVATDPGTGRLRIDPLGRHPVVRTLPVTPKEKLA